jgi:hypothetical protein
VSVRMDLRLSFGIARSWNGGWRKGEAGESS